MDFDPEMPHIQIEGFTPGDAQHYGAEYEKSMETIAEKKLERVQGIDRGQDLGPGRYGHEAQPGEDYKPENHHRTKKFADAAGSMSLGPKQEEQDHAG